MHIDESSGINVATAAPTQSVMPSSLIEIALATERQLQVVLGCDSIVGRVLLRGLDRRTSRARVGFD